MAGRRRVDKMGLLTLKPGEEKFWPVSDPKLRHYAARNVYDSGNYYRRRGYITHSFSVRETPEGIYYCIKERGREHQTKRFRSGTRDRYTP